MPWEPLPGAALHGELSPAGIEGMLCTGGMIHPSAIYVQLLCSEVQCPKGSALSYSPPCEGEADRECCGFPLRYYMEGVSILCDWVQFRGVDA